MYETYGFGGRLSPDYPSQVVVDITERCNLVCIHCGHDAFTKSINYSARDMEMEIHNKLVTEIAQAGETHPGVIRYIRYTAQGEPLLHPLVFDFLKEASNRAKTRISLTSNGLLLDDSAADRLLDSGVDIVDFSIDACTPESYSRIRRNGNYRDVVVNIQNLLRKRSQSHSRMRIVTTFIEQEANYGEGDDFQHFWEDQGADYVILRRLHSFGGYVKPISQKLRKELQGHVRRPCLYPWERLSITPGGDISFCPASWTEETHFASLRSCTIAEAWRGTFMRNLRKAHIDGDYSACAACAKCPDWAQTRWPHEGASFADMVEKLCPERQSGPCK